MNIKLKIEEILVNIKRCKQDLSELELQYNEEIEKVKAKYYNKIEDIKKDIRQSEDDLQKLALKHKYDLFEGDMAEFKNGILILQIKQAVKRVRGMLERLENLGWTEALIIDKKVNWDELEKWTDERLIAAGTERITKETITYEIK